MRSKALTFSVEKCQNSTKNNNNCASPEEINRYIKDISVDYWSIEWFMDFSLFRGIPIKRQMRFLG